MKVCLVSPPTVTEFEGSRTSRSRAVRLTASYPPLGILSLAAILEQQGIAHELFDLNQLFWETVGARDAILEGGFFSRAVTEMEGLRADVFGFGTISSSYPLTLRLAREIKRLHPGAMVILGGPQATAVDVATLDAFPFVDAIVRGEAEETLPALLRAGGLGPVPGITFRRGGKAVRTPDSPGLPDLDRLPLPAFHLWPGIRERRTIPLEAGRGCPFCCTFCSTSRFFRRRFRLKTPERVIAQMIAVRDAHGVETFHLAHDSFTVVRAKVVEFCRAMLASAQSFRWTCSARTDCVDQELLALMAEAGCIGIFFGIETGSPEVQRAIGKNLDLVAARDAIRIADRLGICTTVSLITGFPEETPADVSRTSQFLMDAVRLDKVDPQFHLLAPLAGSAIEEEYRGRLEWDGIFSDMAFQGWRQDAEDRALALAHPEIFPNFYAAPAPLLRRSELMEFRDFLMYGLARFRWLLIALDQSAGGVAAVFERWRSWRAEHHPAPRPDGEYYAGAEFRSTFLEFVSSIGDDPEAIAVRTLLEYELALERLGERERARPVSAPEVVDLDSAPRVAPGVALLELGADYEALIERLRAGRPARDVPRRKVVVADREMPNGSVEVRQLTTLSAALLRLCDGARTVRDIACLFAGLDEGLEEFPPEPACAVALSELARQGLVTMVREL